MRKLLIVLAFLLAACGGKIEPVIYHVTCYSYGNKIYDNDVYLSLSGSGWVEVKTGNKVMLNGDCIYTEVK